ncbi:hydroxymyristoyl-ACP dehydratase [Serratia microhaemolytica]|uniref:ApeI family dehydratase n=1 Tax=Serratia microhaemolytica TaxID=2675110 RepID=UPI000FDE5E9A|nr:hydroxymyristoyl-ACP dehydratase [Serratia microhaemolytica]
MKPNNVTHQQITPNQYQLQFVLEPELFWFRGHFAIQPLLPGVAQLDWVMHYAGQLLAPGFRFHSIQSVKFQAPLLPNDQINLTLIWQPARELLSFNYQRHQGTVQQTASSGKIRLCR